MPIICDWCNISLHRRDVCLSLADLRWGMEWNERRHEDWPLDASYLHQDGDYVGKGGLFYGLNEGPNIGFFSPKYVSVTVSNNYSGSLESQLSWLDRYSSSGEPVVTPSGHFCEECFEEIAQQCFECSSRANPPFDQGGWMGFTSKHVFTGDMNQPPVIIAVCAAKLDCIDCEHEYHSLHVVYRSGNNGQKYPKEEWSDGAGEMIGSGRRWVEDDLELGRGPMVDYLRRGEWNSWIFNEWQDGDGEWEKVTVSCPNLDGALTKKGWVCADCDC